MATPDGWQLERVVVAPDPRQPVTLLVDDPDLRVHVGGALDVLRELPDQSVHCVATSPPFFGLRDYGTGSWVGGDAEHEHDRAFARGGRGGSGAPGKQTVGSFPLTVAVRECSCGAVYEDPQIGLEDSPDEWVAALVEVFKEARRVLRDDGTLWVECGDSYAANRAYQVADTKHRDVGNDRGATVPEGLKEKDLVLAPMLLAFALRADGWTLRGAYVWEKPDAMPESVTDRCTVSHSFVFQFAKSGRTTFWTHRDGRGCRSQPAPDYRWVDRETGEESDVEVEGWRRVNLWRGRDYFFDRDAIREPFSDYGDARGAGNTARTRHSADAGRPREAKNNVARWFPYEYPASEVAQLDLDGNDAEPEVRGPDGRREFALEGRQNSEQHRDGSRWPSLEGRSPRSVWRIATESSSFGLCPECRTYWDRGAPAKHCGVPVVAHFAVWPHELVGKIISCATSEAGCCADCGAPRFRQVERTAVRPDPTQRSTSHYDTFRYGAGNGGNEGLDALAARMRAGVGRGHAGWFPTCECDAPSAPCVILDPFAGSATTGRQARAMGRAAVLIELNPLYAEIAAHRTAQLGLLSEAT